MNLWLWKSKGQKKDSRGERIQRALSGKPYGKLPNDIRKLDDSYRMLIRELAKR